jgi:uncharacterized protein YbbC (DUF1343 family)
MIKAQKFPCAIAPWSAALCAALAYALAGFKTLLKRYSLMSRLGKGCAERSTPGRYRAKKAFALLLIFVMFCSSAHCAKKVELGIDIFFKDEIYTSLKHKKVGLITNQTGLSRDLHSTIDLFKQHAKHIQLVALFSPEHGIEGASYAGEHVDHTKANQLPVYSLHGKTRRPTDKMLEGIDVLIFDIQDIGVRAYTYEATLFYVMEEAAKRQIEVIVLDRPNPINGLIVDGPMLQKEWRSFLGYVNVPYCHGMTLGELARFFNTEYRINCALKIVQMTGWERWMTFKDTGLHWIPTSPNVPEADTPIFAATTGILGELSIVNIGIGYTMPFKIVGAPWIKAKEFAEHLNSQKMAGVQFLPFHFRPMFGLYASKNCEGVNIIITDVQQYHPVSVQYLLMGMLKTMYPKEVGTRLDSIDPTKKKLFCQANGNEELFSLLKTERYPAWKMIQFEEDQRKLFLQKRQKYLLY